VPLLCLGRVRLRLFLLLLMTFGPSANATGIWRKKVSLLRVSQVTDLPLSCQQLLLRLLLLQQHSRVHGRWALSRVGRLPPPAGAGRKEAGLRAEHGPEPARDLWLVPALWLDLHAGPMSLLNY
jgi:hypothetical protein